MDDPLHHRDQLEQHVLAFGEPIAPEQLPANLAWQVWRPVTQRVYLWAWATHHGYLYCRLDDAYDRGGLWRAPLRHELRRYWRAARTYLGPISLAAADLQLAVCCLDLTLS